MFFWHNRYISTYCSLQKSKAFSQLDKKPSEKKVVLKDHIIIHTFIKTFISKRFNPPPLINL